MKQVQPNLGRTENRPLSYGEYLRTKEWKKLRADVLRRDRGRCAYCGRKRATQIHHLTYKHIFHESLEDLVAVCRECHEAQHPDKTKGASRTEIPKLPFKFKCPWCQKMLRHEGGLPEHIRRFHGPNSKPTLEQLEDSRREAERQHVIRMKELRG